MTWPRYAQWVGAALPVTLGLRMYLRGMTSAAVAEAAWLAAWAGVLWIPLLLRGARGEVTIRGLSWIRPFGAPTLFAATFLVLHAVAYWRGTNVTPEFGPGVMLGQFVRLAVVVFSALAAVGSARGDLRRLVDAITVGLLLSVSLNLIGAITGVANPSSQPVNTGPTILVSSGHTVFPFSANPRAFGVEAGLLLAMALAPRGRTAGRRGSFWPLLTIVVGGIGIWMSDTRSVLLGVLLATAVAHGMRRAVRGRWALVLLLIVSVVPAVVMRVDARRIVTRLPVGLSGLSRTSRLEELVTLNNRAWIWGSTLRRAWSADPLYIILGQGYGGHIRIGAASDYGRYSAGAGEHHRPQFIPPGLRGPGLGGATRHGGGGGGRVHGREEGWRWRRSPRRRRPGVRIRPVLVRSNHPPGDADGDVPDLLRAVDRGQQAKWSAPCVDSEPGTS